MRSLYQCVKCLDPLLRAGVGGIRGLNGRCHEARRCGAPSREPTERRDWRGRGSRRVLNRRSGRRGRARSRRGRRRAVGGRSGRWRGGRGAGLEGHCTRYSAYQLSGSVTDSVINVVLNVENTDDVAGSVVAPLTPR